jgi:uncharacterized protein
MGICLEPPEFVTGLARVPNGVDGDATSVEFEQYERHTAWDRAGGVAERSGAGDLDVIIYSARKWCRLALAGNPTVLIPLFVPDVETMVRTADGSELVDNAHRFVSKLAADRFLGYLNAQRGAMTGESGAHTNRPELVAIHGFDTKYAAHAVRLGIQGVELLTTGRMNLPMLDEHRDYLRAVRRGEVPLDDVLRRIARYVGDLTSLRDSSSVPDQPDREWVDRWLHRAHLEYWASALDDTDHGLSADPAKIKAHRLTTASTRLARDEREQPADVQGMQPRGGEGTPSTGAGVRKPQPPPP